MKLKRLVPMAAAVALLAGCGTSPQHAVTVDDATLTHADVNRQFRGCYDNAGVTDPSFNGSEVVRAFVMGQIFDKAAASVPEAAGIEDYLVEAANAQAPALMADPGCAEFALNVMKASALGQLGLTQEQGVELMESIQIDINPRYGTFDPVGGEITTSGSMSVPELDEQ